MNRLPLLLLAGVLAGCGANSNHPSAPAPSATPVAALPTCADVGSGFLRDAARSGPLTAATYSAAADVQAALVYDKLQRGTRSVYTHLTGGTQVIECTVLEFPTAQDAHRFALSFRDLRRQAGSLVTELAAPAVPGAAQTMAYREQGQAFRGYGITSTQVIEVAAQTGARLAIVGLAGPTARVGAAQTLLLPLATA